MKTWSVGILGGGGISDTHARAVDAVSGAEVVAVCGENRGKVARLAERHAAAAYEDLAPFLKHRPLDVVAIGSPSGRHAEQAIACARAGLHVLAEKPLALSTAEVDAVLAALEVSGTRLGVFFQDRLQPDFVRLKAFLARRGLGRVHLATAHVKWYRATEYYSSSRWRGTWVEDGGGAVMNQGIHTLDLLLHLLGDVRRVHALTRTASHAIEVEDTAVALLEMACGALATYEATTAAFPGYKRRLEVSGEQGTIVVEHDRVVAADLRPGTEPFDVSAPAVTGESASSPLVSDAAPHARIFEDFLEALETGRPPVCDGREGRRSVEVVEALYASARTGAPVGLTP